MAVQDPGSSRSGTIADESGGPAGGDGLRLVVPAEIREAVLAVAASGEDAEQQIDALRDAATRFAISEGATPESAAQAAGAYIDLVLRGLADPSFGDALAQRVFNDSLTFGTAAETPDPAEALLTALAGGQGLDEAVDRLLLALPETAGLEGEALAAARAGFLASLQNSLGQGGNPADAIAAAQAAVTAARDGAAAAAGTADGLAEALSSGQEVAAAIADAAARSGFDGATGSGGTAIFEAALAQALSSGAGTEGAMDAAAGQAEAAAAAQAEAALPMSPADQLLLALSAGAGSEGFDAIIRLFGLDGASGDAFAAALQRALAGGDDIAEAVESAADAADQAESAEAAQAVDVTPAGQLAQALANGQMVDQALAALGGDAGGEAFAQALTVALSQGGDMASAIQSGGQAAAASRSLAASQQVSVSAADQLVAALSSGDGADAAQAVASLANGSGEAFANQLMASLAGGSDAISAVNQARSAGEAAAVVAQVQAVPVSEQGLLALAQGASPAAGQNGSAGGLDVIAQALAAIAPAAGGPAASGAASSGAGTAAVAQGSDSGASTGDAAAASGSEAGSTGAGVTQAVQAVGGDSAGQDAAAEGGAEGDGSEVAEAVPPAQQGGNAPTTQQASPPVSFTPTVTLAGTGAAGNAPAGSQVTASSAAGSAAAGPSTSGSTTGGAAASNTTTVTTPPASVATPAATGTPGSSDTLAGGSGSDTLAGGSDSGSGSGAGGGDAPAGGSGGSDTLNGGSGGEIPDGGSGGDSLDGGAGGESPAESVNAAPRAVADTATLAAGGSRSIDVLQNDSDPDAGDSLALTAIGTPSRGTARIDAGRILFDAGSDFQSLGAGAGAVVDLAYTVSDSSGATASATLSITVSGVNDAPVARDDLAGTTENAGLTVDVLGNDSDPDAGDSLALTGVSVAGSRGSATIANNRLVFDPGNDFDYLAAGQSETVTIGYTMADGKGGQGSASLTVTVTGSNDAPVAVADTVTMHEDEAKPIAVTGNDGDAEDGSAGLALLSYSLLSGVGTLSHAGQLLIFEPASSYQALDPGDTAEIRIAYVVTDSAGSQAASTVTITMHGRNDVPVAVADIVSLTEEDTLTLDLLANDTDIDGDDGPSNFLLKSITQTSGLGTASLVGNRLFYDPGSSYQDLDDGDTATISITYVMADTGGLESTGTATLTVTGVNDIPVAVADAGGLTEDGTLTLDLLANDTDMDGDDGPTTFLLQSVTVSSGLGAASVAGNQLFYDPGSSYQHLDAGDTATVTIDYVMADDSGATATATTVLTVTGANDAPVGVADAVGIGENGAPITVDVLANDTDVDADDGPSGFTLTAASVPAGRGSVSIVANRLRFDPGADFDRLAGGATEDVAISYSFTDDSGATGSAVLTVTVTGANDAPGIPPGHALRFDGVDDAVVVADHDLLDFAAGERFSIEAWIRLDAVSGTYAIVDKPATDGSVTGYYFYVADGRLGLYSTGGGTVAAGAATVGAGSWTHVAVVHDGTSATLYSNGVAVGSGAWTSGGATTGDLTIGRIIGGDHFDGEMADLRIWSRDLSQGELQHLMRQDTARDHAGLVADFDFSGSGGTLADMAGSAQSGTLVNGAAWSDLHTISVSRGEAYRNLLLGSDIDLDPLAANLTYSVSSAASHGTVTLSGNTYTYLHDGSNNGADSFQITISDGSATRVQTVSVAVNTGNKAPIAPSLKAIRLDGVNDYIAFSDSGVFERGNGGELTAQAWIKLDSTSGHVPIFDKPTGADSNPANWRLEVVDGQLRLWSSGGGSVDQGSGATIQAGGWYNIAVSVAGNGAVRLYLDGVLVGSAADWDFGATNSGPFYIGRDGAGRYMDGEIAQMRIWQDTLSQAEIQAGMSRKASDSITQLWAHFNLDGSGITVIDQGGGVAQNGTLKNGATRIDLVNIGIGNDESYSGFVLGDEPDANIRSQGLSYSLASQPLHGTVTLTGNKFVYDHAGDGQNDSFDVFISDGTAVTRQTIAITVVNNSPPVLAESNTLVFDGTDDYVTVAHHPDLSFGSGDVFSLDLWVKPDGIAGNVILLDKAGSLVSQSNYRLELESGGIRIWSWDNAGEASELTVGDSGIVAGAWNHVAFAYDGAGTGRLYLNGVEIGSGTWSPQFAGSDDLLLGRSLDGRFFGGEMGDVRIWNRALSPSELQNLMSQDARTDLTGLVLDLDFGGQSTTVADDAGTAQNGTLHGVLRGSATTINLVRDGTWHGLLLGNDAETTPLAGQLNYAVTSGPANGTVTFDGNRFIYDHDGSDTTGDSFTISISDGSAVTSQVITVAVDTAATAPAFGPQNALVLDGVDDYVATPDSAGFDRSGSDPLTLEAWIKADTVDGHFAIFDKSPDLATDNANYRLEMIDGALKLYSNGGIDFQQSSGAITAGAWHHVAATYDGAGNAALYLDGALVGSTAGWSYTGGSNAGDFLIGRDGSATGRHFDGQIAEVRYWTSALSQAEIQAGMTRAAGDGELPLATRYGFTGGGNTVADDAGGSAQDGTLVNGAARSDLLAIQVRNDAVYHGLLLADDGDSLATATALSYEIAGKPLHGSLSLDGNRFTYDHVGDGLNDSFAIWVSDGTNRSLKTFAVSTTNAAPLLTETSVVTLDGSDDYLSIADHDELEFTGGDAFSLEMWLNPDDIAGNNVLMDKRWGGGGNDTSYRLELDDGGIRLLNDDGAGNASSLYADTKAVTAGRWHHVVAAYDGAGTARIYIDGTLASSGSWGNVQAGGGELWVGRAVDGRYYDGQIGEVRVWDKALGLAEIQHLKTQDIAGNVANLVLDLDFTGSGGTVTDDAGTAQDATLTNGAARLATGNLTVTDDGIHSGLFLAQDPDINPLAYSLSYSVTLAPEHGAVTMDGNRYLYDHAGDGSNDSFEITLSDGAASVSQLINVTVDATNRPPGLAAMHALVFDGSDDHVAVADHADLDFGPTDPLTLEAWIQLDSLDGEHNIFDKSDNSAGVARNYRVYVRDGVLGFHNGIEPVLEDGPVIAAGEWSHIAFTFDGTTARLYKDGAEVVSGARQLGLQTDTALTIGRDATGRFFDGQMTELRVWDRALDQAEIQAGMTRKADQATANLVLQFDGDAVSGAQVADGSGNGHAGTLQNGTHLADLKAVQIADNSVYKGLLLGTDGEGSAISGALDYHLARAPEHGTLAMNGNEFVYDHDGGGADDSFQVAIDDGSATSYHDVTFTVV